MADDILAPPYVGTEEQQTKSAARDLAESRRANENEHVDKYLRGDYEDAPKIRVGSDAAKRATSKNVNSPGLDARATAKELAAYREGRQRQMAGELRDNYGLTPADATAAGEVDPEGYEPQHAQPQPRHERAEPQPQPAEPDAHAQQLAHAQAQAQAHAALAQAQLEVKAAMASRYPDIQTMADAEILARTDPARFQQMLADNEACTAALQQQHAAQQEYAQQHAAAWSAEQDRAFAAAAPDAVDSIKGPALQQAAYNTLQGLGFTRDELAHSWNGGPLRDHRVQQLVRKAALFDQAVAAAGKPSPRPVPSVQRPGTGRPRGADIQDDGRAFDAKGGGIRAAARLLLQRRASSE